MPYFTDPNLEKDDQTPGEVQISGASPTTNNEGNDQQQGNAKSLNTGSGFQNLDKYLQTNQSQQFGQQVLGNVQGEVNEAKQNMTDASQKFKSQVAESNVLPTTDQVNKAIANPTAADPKQFQQWQSQTYTGPQDLASSKDAWSQYWSGSNKANTSAQLLGSEPGRFTLLDSYYGKPNYNFGEKSLDNLLVQQSGLGNKTRDVQNQATQLKTQGNQGAKELQGFASTRAGEVEQSKNRVRQAIGLDDQGNVITGDNAGAIGKQYETANADLAAQNAARQTQVQAFSNELANSNLSSADLAKYGLSGSDSIYNLNPSSYLTPGSDLNINQTLTPERRSYIQALSQLAGVTDTFASGAPQSVTNPYTFDTARLQNDEAAAKGTYNTAFNTKSLMSEGGGVPYSMADLQTHVDNIKAVEARNGLDPNNPSTWKGSIGDTARDYINRINAFNKQYGLGNTLGGGREVNSISPKGIIARI